MSMFSSDFTVLTNAVNSTAERMESATAALSFESDLPLAVAMAADDEYEQFNTESNFVVDNLTKALDWLEDLIRRMWLYVKKGIALIKGYVKKFLGHASWLIRIFKKYIPAFETLISKNVKSKDCLLQSREHPINLMSATGFNQATFVEETKRLVDLAAFMKGDYLDTSEVFANSFAPLFERAARLTPDEVIDEMNHMLRQITKSGQRLHPVSLLVGGSGDMKTEPVTSTSYDSNAFRRSATPFLGGHCWSLSWEVDGKKRSELSDGFFDNDSNLQLITNAQIKFGPDHSTINRHARIVGSDKLAFTNEPGWIKDACVNLKAALELTHELYLSTKILDIEQTANRVQKSIDRYFSTVRDDTRYSEEAGKHIAYIKLGTKYIPNIMQPLQGVPNAIIRISSSFISLVDVALDNYETA